VASISLKIIYEGGREVETGFDLVEGVDTSEITDQNLIDYAHYLLCHPVRPVKTIFRDGLQIFSKGADYEQ